MAHLDNGRPVPFLLWAKCWTESRFMQGKSESLWHAGFLLQTSLVAVVFPASLGVRRVMLKGLEVWKLWCQRGGSCAHHCRPRITLCYFPFYSVFFFFFFFLGPHLQHMEVPWLEVKSELQLPDYGTATAMPRSETYLWDMLQLAAMPDSLTHWVKPGIEPLSWWVLVVFVTT